MGEKWTSLNECSWLRPLTRSVFFRPLKGEKFSLLISGRMVSRVGSNATGGDLERAMGDAIEKVPDVVAQAISVVFEVSSKLGKDVFPG